MSLLFNSIQKSHFFASIPHRSSLTSGCAFVRPAVVEGRRRGENREAAIIHEEVFVRIFVFAGLGAASKTFEAQIKV